MIIVVLDEITELKKKLDRKIQSEIDRLDQEKIAIAEQVKKYKNLSGFKYNPDFLKPLIEKPYKIVPYTKGSWRVVTPKLFDFSIGWIEDSDEAWNVFIVNKFAKFIGDIPLELESKFKFKPSLPLKIWNGILQTGKEHQEDAWVRYKKFLHQRKGTDKIRIKKGKTIDLIASLLDDGILPFLPQKVSPKDLRTPPIDLEFELRDYQQSAYEKFLELGWVGIYWAMSAGKSFLALWAMAHLKGRKIIWVPNKTIKGQWKRDYIDRWIPFAKHEIDVEVYHKSNINKVRKNEYVLSVFDEGHRILADTFIEVITLNTKYTMLLTGTPYREDSFRGKNSTAYILAIGGFPIGLDWKILYERGLLTKPDIKLFLAKTYNSKKDKLDLLLGQDVDGKTIIFCDSKERGYALSKEYEIPFVSGDISNIDTRLDLIKNSETVIVSRIADEGLSIKDIARIIEFDFQFGSRRQELQRLGRAFHSLIDVEYIILMTLKEYDEYNKRFTPFDAKGLKIQYIMI